MPFRLFEVRCCPLLAVTLLPSFRTLGHQRTVAPISCDRVLMHDWTPWWRLMECRRRSAWSRFDVDDPTVSSIQLAGAFRIGGRWCSLRHHGRGHHSAIGLRYCSKCIAMVSVINTSMVSANSVADGDSYCNAVRIQNSNSLFNKLKTDKSDFSFHGCGPIIAYNRFMI